jgi:hypothetical protein
MRRRREVTAQAALTIAVPALVAILGFLAAYLNNLRLASRKDRLDRINRQLSDFYGPLLSLSEAGNGAWRAFRGRWRPGPGSYWTESPPPTDDEKAAWRLWMTTVFMPLNRRMRDIVIGKADLLDEDEMPSCLIELCAHVATYEAVLARWDKGDFSEHKAYANFPTAELGDYASRSFRRLKGEQGRLLQSKPTSPIDNARERDATTPGPTA